MPCNQMNHDDIPDMPTDAELIADFDDGIEDIAALPAAKVLVILQNRIEELQSRLNIVTERFNGTQQEADLKRMEGLTRQLSENKAKLKTYGHLNDDRN